MKFLFFVLIMITQLSANQSVAASTEVLPANNRNAANIKRETSILNSDIKNELLLNFSELRFQQSENDRMLGIYAGYNRSLLAQMQISVRGGFTSYSEKNDAASSYKSMNLGVGPTFNFGATNIESKYFTGLVYEYSTKKFENNYYVDRESRLVFEFGKRFLISQSLTYRPYFRLSEEIEDSDGKNEPAVYSLNLLAFSYVF